MFDVVTPYTLNEALDALASGGNVVPLAGGTDVMVGLEAGTLGQWWANDRRLDDVS